jgi:hypothetical protein
MTNSSLAHAVEQFNLVTAVDVSLEEPGNNPGETLDRPGFMFLDDSISVEERERAATCPLVLLHSARANLLLSP